MLFKFNSAKCVLYAKNHVKNRNPFYKVFNANDEDCNFISQCLLAGCEGLDGKTCVDWFYHNEANYSLAWHKKEELIRYLLNKTACGPFGRVVNRNNVSAGDIVFQKREDEFVDVGIVSKVENEKIYQISKKSFLEEKEIIECDNKIFIHVLGFNK